MERTERQENSVKQDMNQAEESILNLQSNLRDCKHFAEDIRAELRSMDSSIKLSADDTSALTSTKIDELMADLQRAIQSQLDQNTHFNMQITELKKDKSILQQRIIKSRNRSQTLEQDVGVKSKKKSLI
ncbi:unnamed protein product [Blepharisma stoltei]|uniref:Uncharacterized protein n=1 Tax=Blepharisma stoltei TaxID=1481888 RepID=A0AAU9JNR7_9CILI|nr:unnamed protein product [Blepharisma stoltei]